MCYAYPTTSFVNKTPALKSSLGRLGQNAVRDILEANAVDQPLAILALENKLVVDRGAVCWLATR